MTEKFKERTYVGAGLALYDALRGFQRALPWHKHISQSKIAEIAPSLRTDIVTGAIKYFDAQVDDARHTMAIARTAVRHGAVIATGVRADSLIRDGKRVVGVIALDSETKKKITIKATATVMCAGVWSDELQSKFDLKAGYKVTMSKGVHIVLPRSAITSEAGVIIKTQISVLFLIPWGDKWIVGTTDTPYTGDKTEPVASAADVEYILNEANRVLKPKIKREDIIGVYAGLRPLISNNKNSATTKLSREHTVDRPTPGFLSVAGGKYTTYRIMAKDVIDLAVNELRRITLDSVTEKLPVVGADGYAALVQQSAQIAQIYEISEESVIHLLNRHGSLINEVLEIIADNPEMAERIDPALPYLKAEIEYAASHEGARSVEDVISRRTRIAFESHDHGIGVATEVATIIGTILGWGAKERKASINSYRELVERENVALGELINS
ncbi:unannotated protein [freshwater metagenome]|uniref:Unannotated protein n=1 Tax=freshwater metagenome TaxID=449393 RepID=A0A6J7N748_9ZZZZ